MISLRWHLLRPGRQRRRRSGSHSARRRSRLILPSGRREISAGGELASAVLSPQTLPAFLTPEKAEERGHVKRLYEQQPNSDTVIFQNRDGSTTLYCPVGSLSDVLTQSESGAKDRAEIAALERAVQKKFDLKPEQIGAVYTEDGMAVVAFSEIGGDYYINSYGSARFLSGGGARISTMTGTTAAMGNAAVFKIQNAGDGYHYIQPYADSSKYFEYYDSTRVLPVSYPAGRTPPDLARWQLVEDGSMYRIVNKATGYSFYSDNASIYCSAEQANENPDGRRWRLLDKDSYRANELTGFTLSTYEVVLRMNGSGKLQIRTTPSTPLLATGNDFRINTQEGHIVDSTSNGKAVFFTGLETGVAEVEIVHIPSGLKAGKVSLRVAPGSGQHKLRSRAYPRYVSYSGRNVVLTSDSQKSETSFAIVPSGALGAFYIKASNGQYVTATENILPLLAEKSADTDSQLWFYGGEDGCSGAIYSKKDPSRALVTNHLGELWLGAFSDDEEFSDEWILFREGETTLGLPGYNAGDTMMKSVSRSINLSLRKVPVEYPNTYRYIDSDLGLTAMRESPIVLFNTHGEYDRITMTHTLPGESDSVLTMAQVKALPAGAFSNTKMVVYIACLTAKGGATANNLFKATVDKGAEIVIGFSGKIQTIECNFWNQEFFRVLSNRGTVAEAIQKAQEYASEKGNSSTMRTYLVTSGNLQQFVYSYYN